MPTSVDEDEIPTVFTLGQNYPNPFNPTTRIKFSTPPNPAQEKTSLSLKVYDIIGNEVATLVNEEKPGGEYEVVWNASNVSSGIYFYRLAIPGIYSRTMKMILLK